MQKVAGERYVYRFVCNPEALFSLAFPDGMRPLLKPQCCQPQRVTDQQLIAGTRDVYSATSYMNNSPSAFSRYNTGEWAKPPDVPGPGTATPGGATVTTPFPAAPNPQH